MVSEDSREPFSLKLIFGILLSCALISNSGSLFYVTFKLKLNEHLLKILKLHLIIVIVCIVLSNIGYVILYFTGIRNLYTCSLYMLPIGAGAVSSYLFPAAIAAVRYHIANEAANQKFFRRRSIVLIVTLAVLCELQVILAMFLPTFNNQPFGPVLEACYTPDKESQDHVSFGPLVVLVTNIAALTIGILYDLAMLRFLRQRRQVTPALAMVAWGQPPLVAPGSNDNSSKATVPIQATCLGIVNLCVVTVYFYVFVLSLGSIEDMTYFMLSAGIGILVVHMPLVLLLTVKSNEKRIAKSFIVPPNQLQFHDEDNS